MFNNNITNSFKLKQILLMEQGDVSIAILAILNHVHSIEIE